jgi:hypothetical protein
MTFDDERATGTTRANSQAALYRELTRYPMSRELRQHTASKLMLGSIC